MSAAQKIKIGGKELEAKLSIDAIERIESQFNDESLGMLLKKGGSVRVAKAILIACIADQNSTMQISVINELVNTTIEEDGLDKAYEIVKTLIDASGFYGRDRAKAASLGK